MEPMLVIKFLVLTLVWQVFMPFYMEATNRPPNGKNIIIVLLPAILWFFWFLLFWWG